MAKLSSINKNNRRKKMAARDYSKRMALKKVIMDKKITLEERVNAVLTLAALPRNGAIVRVRNRCEHTGRARGYLRKFRLSRICVRSLANEGKLPGVKKASW